MSEQTEETTPERKPDAPVEFPIQSWIDYLIDAHPDFFLPRRGAWMSRTDEETRMLVHRIDHAILAHWVDVHARTIRSEKLPEFESIKRCVDLVKSTIVSQRVLDIELYEDELRRVDFRHTGFSRLLRGLTNCEGMSHILFELLRKIGIKASIFEVMDDDGCARHNLLKIDSSLGWCFADAWARFSLYWVSDLFVEAAIPGLPELESINTENASADGLFPRSMYLKGWVPGTRYYPLEPLSRQWHPPESEAPATDTAWQALLRLRKKHVLDPFGSRIDYLGLLHMHRYGGMTRELIVQLTKLPPISDGDHLAADEVSR